MKKHAETVNVYKNFGFVMVTMIAVITVTRIVVVSKIEIY